MLVLSRREGEQIVLPSLHVTITLIRIKGERARIGIDAPVGVPVHRSQIWDEILSLGQNSRCASTVGLKPIPISEQIEAIEYDIRILRESYTNRSTGVIDDQDALRQIHRLEAALSTLRAHQPQPGVPAA